jgi:hypothetical protein
MRPTRNAKDDARAQIEAQTKAFLESGGKIEQHGIRFKADLGKEWYKSMTINYRKPTEAPSKPVHSIRELAELIGITKGLLAKRIMWSAEKPVQIENVSNVRKNHQPCALYYKDDFIAWHNRNWIDNGRANKKSIGKSN